MRSRAPPCSPAIAHRAPPRSRAPPRLAALSCRCAATPSQVAEKLGLKMSKEQVAQAKVDKQIVDRLVEALHQLKQCRSGEEWVDYHVVLGAVAPKREVAGSHDGCLNAVFKRLGVTPGSRYVKATGEKRPRAPDQAVRAAPCPCSWPRAPALHRPQPAAAES